MKTILRILAILSAALVIVGITVAFAQSSYAENLTSSMRGNGPPQMIFANGTATDVALTGPPAGAGQGNHDQQSPNLAGGVEIIKDLAIIGVIVTVVSFALRLIPRRKPKGRAAPPRPVTTSA